MLFGDIVSYEEHEEEEEETPQKSLGKAIDAMQINPQLMSPN